MSNAASLASAKNRRSRAPAVQFQQPQQQSGQLKTPQQQQQQQQQQNILSNTNNKNTEPVTPLNLLKQHDLKIYCLEKQLEKQLLLHNGGENSNTEQQNFVTKQDLELLKFDNSVTSKVDNKLSNVVDTNTQDIVALKSAVAQFTKTFSELNSQIQMLKATVLSQGNEIVELLKMKEEYDTLQSAPTKDNSEENEENDNDASDDSVKLTVSEKN